MGSANSSRMGITPLGSFGKFQPKNVTHEGAGRCYEDAILQW